MGNKISHGAAAGRVAVITGGASGIGLGVAEQCARLRMKICIADLAQQHGVMKEVEPRLRALGAEEVLFHATDVAKYEQVQALADAVYAKWGDVGFLMNNAGLNAGAAGWDGSWNPKVQSLEGFRLTIDVDLYGVLHGHHAFIPRMMKQQKESVVVNTSSQAGLSNTAYTPNGTTGMAYTVAKNGVTLLTESLSAAMRSHDAPIAVHVLCPYGTMSSMGLNNLKYFAKFKDEAKREKAIRLAEKRAAKVAAKGAGAFGAITPERNAQILQECIELGRFYCVTPDRTASTNTSRAWMLARAEDFINDNPPFTSAPGRAPFRALSRAVEARMRGPNHKFRPGIDGPANARSPYAGRKMGEQKKSKL